VTLSVGEQNFISLAGISTILVDVLETFSSHPVREVTTHGRDILKRWFMSGQMWLTCVNVKVTVSV